MDGSHLAYADSDLIRDATLSVSGPSSPAEDPDYPVENLQDDNPALPFKAMDDAVTIAIHLASAKTPDFMAIINHNLAGSVVSLQNASGFNEAVAIPARTRAGLCVNVGFDLRAFTNRTDDDWSLVITAAAGRIAIGRLVLVDADGLQPVPFLVETPQIRPTHLTSAPLRTTYGRTLRFDKAIRMRAAQGQLVTETDRAVIERQWDAAHGSVVPWLYLPDVDVNDAWWVEFTAFEWKYSAPAVDDVEGVSPATVALEELSMGLHLYDLV